MAEPYEPCEVALANITVEGEFIGPLGRHAACLTCSIQRATFEGEYLPAVPCIGVSHGRAAPLAFGPHSDGMLD